MIRLFIMCILSIIPIDYSRVFFFYLNGRTVRMYTSYLADKIIIIAGKNEEHVKSSSHHFYNLSTPYIHLYQHEHSP